MFAYIKDLNAYPNSGKISIPYQEKCTLYWKKGEIHAYDCDRFLLLFCYVHQALKIRLV